MFYKITTPISNPWFSKTHGIDFGRFDPLPNKTVFLFLSIILFNFTVDDILGCEISSLEWCDWSWMYHILQIEPDEGAYIGVLVEGTYICFKRPEHDIFHDEIRH